SYPGFAADLGQPSYVAVIALEHDTIVNWTAKTDTAGDFFPVPFVFEGEVGEMELNERDMMQIAASSNEEDVRKRDLSGMVINATKPVWVVGATSCAFVPFGGQGFCDHLQEQLIPIEQWGKEYVAAHSPVRGTEKHVWRIYGGADNVGVATDPPLDGTPFVLEKTGDYREFEVDNGVSFVVTSNGPIMPVQYLYGSQDGAGTGDPSMYQMVPVEQFLRRYAFATGLNYDDDYVQVTRKKGAAAVLVDGVPVTGYYEIGDYEVADWKVEEGAHFAESSQAFGIAGVGYTQQNASYAYPGGMALEVISPL
ncbi:MAG: IgGFc-binding protein, partial [Nannocystaceae bacterium]